MMEAPRLLPLGDRGLLIELGDTLSPEVNARVRALADRMRGLRGVEEAVPTLRSVLVVFDPLGADLGALAAAAEDLAAILAPAPDGTGRLVEVPVVYGGSAGPDLNEVAALHSLAPQQAIRAHSEIEYTVYMLGFTPGYPYLGILPQGLRTPRLPSPRLRVPEGSVAIADGMTGIYPLASPGGWRLIGRTPLSLYEPAAADPVLFRPGDRVRFVPVSTAAFQDRPEKRPQDPPFPPPRRPVFEVRTPGLYSTIQDAGRFGYRSLGIPPSGAVDPLALWAANAAVGNPPDTPGLEFTAPGPVLRALERVTCAVAGADLSASVDGVAVERGSPLMLRAGQTLEFGAPRAGMWAYLAVTGGVDGLRALRSASTYVPGRLGGSGGRRLREGDVLGAGDATVRAPKAIAPEVVPLPADEVTVRVIPGPQDEWLTEEARLAFLKEDYRISLQSDRAGVRLDGAALAHRTSAEFLSDGVLPGAVQIPAGGQPIIIMPDGPTTGGYPKVAAVITADLRLVAQARPGARVRFRAVAMEAALDALRRSAARRTELATR